MNAPAMGGDFELMPAALRTTSSGISMPLTGRAALHRILTRLRVKHPDARVYLPEYLCASMWRAARAAVPDVELYRIDATLRPAQPGDIAAGAIVVLVRYFGLVDLAVEVARLRAAVPSVVVVADEAHAPWSLGESGADVSFTSWRKAYPVVGGAPIAPAEVDAGAGTDPSSEAHSSAFAATRLAAATLKAFAGASAAIDESAFLALFHRAEAMLEDTWALSASLSAEDAPAVDHLPLEALHERRRHNFHHLAAQLQQRGLHPIVPLRSGATPLFLPVRVADRDAVRRRLAGARIFCPAHWPCPAGLDLSTVSSAARALYTEELSLLVDPRYDIADMDRLVGALTGDPVVASGGAE